MTEVEFLREELTCLYLMLSGEQAAQKLGELYLNNTDGKSETIDAILELYDPRKQADKIKNLQATIDATINHMLKVAFKEETSETENTN